MSCRRRSRRAHRPRWDLLFVALGFAFLAAGSLEAGSSDRSQPGVTATATQEPCVDDDVTLCLGRDRFRITVGWTDFESRHGDAMAIPFTERAGLFYFFAPTNIEMLIKVLDGCAVNGHLWVFFAATTNVELTVEVTDTETGAVATYFNPLGESARAVTDTLAFDSCPPESSPAGHAAEDELSTEVGPPAVAGLPPGPEGTTYETGPFLAAPEIPGLFTITDGGDNVVTFDDRREDLAPFVFGLGTIPRMREEIERLDGDLLRLVFTMDTLDGDELWPAGFTVGDEEIALSDGAFTIGFFPNSDPLDFLNTRVTRAHFALRADATEVALFDVAPSLFFGAPGPWDGNLGITFPGAAGQGIDEIVLTLDVAVAEDHPLCVSDDEALCLRSRFRVDVEWRDFEGESGIAQAVPIPNIGDSGLFTFFDPDNLEMLVKVLDGCDWNDRFWVFSAATTNVEYTLTVTDLETGAVREYHNALGEAAPAITDTSAFATCPASP